MEESTSQVSYTKKIGSQKTLRCPWTNKPFIAKSLSAVLLLTVSKGLTTTQRGSEILKLPEEEQQPAVHWSLSNKCCLTGSAGGTVPYPPHKGSEYLKATNLTFCPGIDKLTCRPNVVKCLFWDIRISWDPVFFILDAQHILPGTALALQWQC